MTALAAETEARMETLRRILAWGDHSRLILVSAAPGPARDAFLERLQAWAGHDGVPRLVELHLGAVERPALAIREAAQELGPGSGLLVLGLEPFLTRGEQATPAIQELNFFRDELADVLPGPLVLVASPDALTHLLSIASDFVSVRAMTLEVAAATDNDPPPPPYDLTEPRSEHPTAEIAKFGAMLEEMDRRQVSEIERAPILLRLARALNDNNAHEEATERAEEALASSRQAGDVRGETRCIQCLGEIAFNLGEIKAADARFHEALARQTDDERGQADAIRGLASLADHASDRAGARARYEEALRLYRRRGDDVGAARVLDRIGREARGRGAYDHGKACHEEALTLSRRTGDVQVEADAISGFGELFFLCSDYAEAAARKEEASLLYRQIGDAGGEAGTLVRLGEIALHRCDWPSARAFFEEARPLFPRLPRPPSGRSGGPRSARTR